MAGETPRKRPVSSRSEAPRMQQAFDGHAARGKGTGSICKLHCVKPISVNFVLGCEGVCCESRNMFTWSASLLKLLIIERRKSAKSIIKQSRALGHERFHVNIIGDGYAWCLAFGSKTCTTDISSRHDAPRCRRPSRRIFVPHHVRVDGGSRDRHGMCVVMVTAPWICGPFLGTLAIPREYDRNSHSCTMPFNVSGTGRPFLRTGGHHKGMLCVPHAAHHYGESTGLKDRSSAPCSASDCCC